MYATLYDVVSAYGLQLALWFGWPCLLAGGLVGVAVLPRWPVAGIVAGAAGGTLFLDGELARGCHEPAYDGRRRLTPTPVPRRVGICQPDIAA